MACHVDVPESTSTHDSHSHSAVDTSGAAHMVWMHCLLTSTVALWMRVGHIHFHYRSTISQMVLAVVVDGCVMHLTQSDVAQPILVHDGWLHQSGKVTLACVPSTCAVGTHASVEHMAHVLCATPMV